MALLDDIRSELSFSASRSSGPGGQNVNKVNSKMTLRWNVADSALPVELKARILERLAGELTNKNEIVIQSGEYRDQTRNKEACLYKLAALLRRALHAPKKRRPTKPKRGAKEKRLELKKVRGRIKALRGKDYSE